MKKERGDILKILAQQAKKRMNGGCYIETESGKRYGDTNAKRGGKVKTSSIFCEYRLQRLDCEEDDILYEKVYDLLRQDDLLINPLGVLVDETKMSKLNPNERVQYVLDLSKKFKKIKADFEVEKNINEIAV